MKPADGLKDDLTDFLGRMREEQYPELSNDEVLKVLQSVAYDLRESPWEQRNKVRWECEAARKENDQRQQRTRGFGSARDLTEERTVAE